MRQTACKTADAHIRKFQQTARNAALRHQLAHQDKERNGQQGERIELLAHLLHHRHNRDIQIQHGQTGGNDHGKRNRAFDDQQKNEGQKQNRNGDTVHVQASPFFCASVSSSMPSIFIRTK